MHWPDRVGVSAALFAAMAAFATQPVTAQTTAVVPQGSSVIIAPTAPPPPQVETIPPPPATTMTWQPGHWRQLGLGPRPVRGVAAGRDGVGTRPVGAAAGWPLRLESRTLELIHKHGVVSNA
jgi:hypothetical protein